VPWRGAAGRDNCLKQSAVVDIYITSVMGINNQGMVALYASFD
jgi:hypothetical protein